MNMIYYRQVEDLETDLRETKNAYLERWGWKRTCNVPGSYWLWQRDFADVDSVRQQQHEKHQFPTPPKPYGVMTVSADLAISMTLRVLDDQPEANEESES